MQRVSPCATIDVPNTPDHAKQLVKSHVMNRKSPLVVAAVLYGMVFALVALSPEPIAGALERILMYPGRLLIYNWAQAPMHSIEAFIAFNLMNLFVYYILIKVLLLLVRRLR